MEWEQREQGKTHWTIIRVKHGRLDMRRNFFSLRVIDSWNQIPNEIKRIEKCENFREAYKTLRAAQLRRALWERRARSSQDASEAQPGADVPWEALPGPWGMTSQTNKQTKRQKYIERHGLRPITNVYRLIYPPCFSDYLAFTFLSLPASQLSSLRNCNLKTNRRYLAHDLLFL